MSGANATKYFGIFNDSYPPILDGVTLTVENYVRWLPSSGKTPCVVTPRNPLPYKTDVKTHRYFSLPISSRHPYRYGYPLADPLIWWKMRTTPFALVHSHCPFSSGRLAVYAAKKQRVPLIGTFHSKYKDDLKHSFKVLPWMTDLIMGRILDFFSACDHVWIPQAKVADTVREYGFKGELSVVENGNDFADIIKGDLTSYRAEAKRRRGLKPNVTSLLFVGQHIKGKGTFTILEALSMLKASMDFRMDFIGTGYAFSELKRRAEELGVSDRVHFHGVVSGRDRLSDFYASADMFLFPSPYDNAPLVVREAAAMGTPSILLRGSTAAEVVKDGYNGILIENTEKNLADAIRHFSLHREETEEIGKRARITLVRSWENVVEEVSGRYDDIIRAYGKK